MTDTLSKVPSWDSESIDEEEVEVSDDPSTYASSATWYQTYRSAFQLVKNSADAEDIAQEAFLRLFERSSTDRKVESFMAWMRGVMSRINLQRFHETRPDRHVTIEPERDDARGLVDILVSSAPSIEEELIRKRTLEDSLRVLLELSELERECVLMYARGFSFVQVANALGITYKVALNTTKRAFVKTKDRIGR